MLSGKKQQQDTNKISGNFAGLFRCGNCNFTSIANIQRTIKVNMVTLGGQVDNRCLPFERPDPCQGSLEVQGSSHPSSESRGQGNLEANRSLFFKPQLQNQRFLLRWLVTDSGAPVVVD